MISPRITCFMFFALLFGTAHANSTSFKTPPSVIQQTSVHGTQNNNATMTVANTVTIPRSIKTSDNVKPESVTTKTQQSVCKPATLEPAKVQCIFFLPTGDRLHLVLVALIVGCFTLLLTTVICGCQVCHLRGIISRLHLRNNNVDLRAIREKSELPYRNEGQVDGQPTETCVMLSEVTTAQEEGREDEERVLENKDTEQPSTMKDPNGDVTQENSHEPDAKAPESSDTGV